MATDGTNDDEFEGIDAALDVSHRQRTPCVLVLDTSASMQSDGRIDNLNAALKSFEKTIKSREDLRQQVVIAVIGFGERVEMLLDWTQADEFEAPELEALGMTPMGEAMRTAHDAVAEISENLRARSIPFTRPWIFLLSDGGPNDDGWQQAAAESRRICEDKLAVVWPLAVPGANAEALKAFARPDMNVYEVAGDGRFDEIFEWLSASLGALVNSQAGEQLQLPAPSSVTVET